MLLPNASVTFTDPTDETGERVLTALVEIYPADKDARLLPWAAEFMWAVCFPGQLTYADGSAIATGHQIAWSQLGTYSDGSARAVTLRRLRRTFGPLTAVRAYFNEQDS